MTKGLRFQCDCGGPTREVDPSTIDHACANRCAPNTSFFDGVERFVRNKRVQINPALTGGELRYNWFVDWK